MPDAVELVKLIKRAALEAVDASKPVNISFGQVVSVSPLQIKVEQKMPLGEKQLILSRNVTDFKTMVTVEWVAETALTTHKHGLSGDTGSGGEDSHTHTLAADTESVNLKHIHNIAGKKEITIHNALKVGDEVILIRQQEGQKYIVIDRIGVMKL